VWDPPIRLVGQDPHVRQGMGPKVGWDPPVSWWGECVGPTYKVGVGGTYMSCWLGRVGGTHMSCGGADGWDPHVRFGAWDQHVSG
jgi:hypothetical protein